ncbi:MAG TPA: peptidoglycan-binding protein [Cyanobacteria bacterium UBA11372]|nr:peptidoglycan-binding protein [Cyanobacteria bacterium UBA11372]
MGGSILSLLRSKKHFLPLLGKKNADNRQNKATRLWQWCFSFTFLLFTFYVSQGMAQTPPVTSGTRPILRTGSEGAAVSELQAVLKLLGYYTGTVDGVYGESTAIAVTQFQRAAGITADGIVGPATWQRLFPQTSPPSPSPSAAKPSNTDSEPSAATSPPATNNQAAANTPQPAIGNLPILRVGTRGPAVFWLQTRLQATGFFRGPVDGIFGEATEIAVKAAQEKFRLPPDGVVGPATWRVLLP